MSPRNKPQQLSRTPVAQSRLFRIERIGLRFDNGTETEFELITSHAEAAVLVIPVDGDELLLIREYAVGTDCYELGFPKGRLEVGEEPTATAIRELQEEVGYSARQARVLRTITLAPGYSDFKTHIVLAEQLYPQTAVGDEPEPVEVVRWPIDKIDTLSAQDDFTEARSLAALLLFKESLKDAKQK